jgi:hypothetical protein
MHPWLARSAVLDGADQQVRLGPAGRREQVVDVRLPVGRCNDRLPAGSAACRAAWVVNQRWLSCADVAHLGSPPPKPSPIKGEGKCCLTLMATFLPQSATRGEGTHGMTKRSRGAEMS